MKRVALFVGIDKYKDPQINDLQHAESDATELYAFFKHKLNFDEVKLLQGVDDDKVTESAGDLISPLDAGDLFVLFFAGHGCVHNNRNLLLFPKANIRYLKYNDHAIPIEMIKDKTTKEGLNRMFILDACRNDLLQGTRGGSAGMQGADSLRDIVATTPSSKRKISPGAFALLCSCDEGQQARELPNYDMGLFSLSLLTGLREWAESGKDLRLSEDFVDEKLTGNMEYYASQVGIEANQRPWIMKTGRMPHLFSISSKPASASSITSIEEELEKDIQQFKNAEEKESENEFLEKAFAERKSLWEQAVTRDMIDAVVLIACCRQVGVGGEIDMSGAVEYFRTAAARNNAIAQRKLGTLLYEGGKGVERNMAEAAELFRKAAEQDDALAQVCLGVAYSKGQGVQRSFAEAVKWYEKAASKGNAVAAYNLALCYNMGKGVERDIDKAIQWYLKAGEQGNPSAQFNLGCSYYEKGGDSLKEAVRWWGKAAVQKHAEAQCNLGTCYYRGKGVAVNTDKAVSLFQDAAEQGSPRAQYYLGLCYRHGEGFEHNDKKAKEWWQKAAAQKYEPAMQALKDMQA